MRDEVVNAFNRIVRVVNKYDLQRGEQMFVNILRHPNCTLTDTEVLALREMLRQAVIDALPDKSDLEEVGNDDS